MLVDTHCHLDAAEFDDDRAAVADSAIRGGVGLIVVPSVGRANFGAVAAVCRDYLNPYINFHRPCLFAETITDAKGRQRKRYPYKLMMTPYEKLKSLPKAESFLRSEIDFTQLDAQAGAMSDNEAAERLNNARAILFKTIFNRSKTAA